jgi:hypothetical protein
VGDWIDDVFDELDGRVVDVATRYRLEDLLETALIEGDEDRQFMERINADELTQDDVNQLFRELSQCQPRIPDQYAPSQTQLARWIRSFCFL